MPVTYANRNEVQDKNQGLNVILTGPYNSFKPGNIKYDNCGKQKKTQASAQRHKQLRQQTAYSVESLSSECEIRAISSASETSAGIAPEYQSDDLESLQKSPSKSEESSDKNRPSAPENSDGDDINGGMAHLRDDTQNSGSGQGSNNKQPEPNELEAPCFRTEYCETQLDGGRSNKKKAKSRIRDKRKTMPLTFEQRLRDDPDEGDENTDSVGMIAPLIQNRAIESKVNAEMYQNTPQKVETTKLNPHRESQDSQLSEQ